LIMNRKPLQPQVSWVIPTPDGDFVATYSAQGLAGLGFPRARGRKSDAEQSPAPTGLAGDLRRWHALTVRAVKAVLAGQDPAPLPPLDLAQGTPFQQSVWAALRKIARGQTASYGRVAAAIGRPKAVRAVGSACGANPVPLLIPCHRVLAATGGLGGFTAGLEWKRILLEREGSLKR
jgi:O-6-methylguanine DNA methyltransferase